MGSSCFPPKPILLSHLSGSLWLDFHLEKLATGVEAKIIRDFGATTSKAYAILMDSRAVRLHVDYEAVRENFNGAGDFLNLFSHMELTGFISRNAFFTIFVDD